jgi:hypothetical protein
VNYCGQELGIKDKVDACKDKIHGWLSDRVSAITNLSPETSGLLVSGGVFGAGFAFYTLKLQDKSQVLHDAKKVGEAKRKIGNAGKFEKLVKPGPFNDGLEAHHMPSERYLEANNINPKQGFASLITKPQHVLTRTYGKKATKLSTSAPYRQELAEDLADYIRVLKKDGSWTPEVSRSLQQGLDNFKREFPDLFRKINQ